jgi:hypothetical protein
VTTTRINIRLDPETMRRIEAIRASEIRRLLREGETPVSTVTSVIRDAIAADYASRFGRRMTPLPRRKKAK